MYIHADAVPAHGGCSPALDDAQPRSAAGAKQWPPDRAVLIAWCAGWHHWAAGAGTKANPSGATRYIRRNTSWSDEAAGRGAPAGAFTIASSVAK